MVVGFNRDMNLKIPITPNWLQPDRSFSGSSKGTPSDSNFEANREADRDAMLKVICSLICENGALKSEIKFLRTQLEVREKPFSKEHRLHVNQADCKDNSENENLEVKVKSSDKKVEDSSSIFNNRFLKPCSYCQEKHIYGYSRCKGYGATCNYCHRINHLEVACTFKYPELRKLRKNNVGKVSRIERMKKKDNCSRSSSRRVSPATSCLDLEIENLENKNSLSRKVANEEDETGSHQAQSLVDVQLTELSSNEIEVEPSEPKMVEKETQIAEKDSKTAEFKDDTDHTFATGHKEDELLGLSKNLKISIKQAKAIKWINSCLKTSYESFEDLKDGKAIRELLDLSIFGNGIKFQHDCCVWSDIAIQLSYDQEIDDEIDLELLRKVQQSEVCKLIKRIRTKVENALVEAKYKENENSEERCNPIDDTEKGKGEETSLKLPQKIGGVFGDFW